MFEVFEFVVVNLLNYCTLFVNFRYLLSDKICSFLLYNSWTCDFESYIEQNI